MEECFDFGSDFLEVKFVSWFSDGGKNAIISGSNAGKNVPNRFSNESFRSISVDGVRKNFLADDNREATFLE